MEAITIQVDSETARAYSTANEAMRRKMAILFRLCVKEITDPNTTLDEAMDRISTVNGNAPCVISSDVDLSSLSPFQDIPIYTPVQFLEQTWDADE